MRSLEEIIALNKLEANKKPRKAGTVIREKAKVKPGFTWGYMGGRWQWIANSERIHDGGYGNA